MDASICTHYAPPLSFPSLSVWFLLVIHLLQWTHYFHFEQSNFEHRFACGFGDVKPRSWIAVYLDSYCWYLTNEKIYIDSNSQNCELSWPTNSNRDCCVIWHPQPKTISMSYTHLHERWEWLRSQMDFGGNVCRDPRPASYKTLDRRQLRRYVTPTEK